MANSMIDLDVVEEMQNQVNDNFRHFIEPFEVMKKQGVKFDRFQIEDECIYDCSDDSVIATISKIFRVDTVEVICSSVVEVNESGLVHYETIEASFKYYSDSWLLGSRSIFINDKDDRFPDEYYQERAGSFINVWWCEWGYEAQTIREHLEIGQQYLPTQKQPVDKLGLVERVVCTAKFPGVNLSFSPVLRRIFVELGNLFDEHHLNISAHEIKTDAENNLILVIGLGVPELAFTFGVKVDPRLKSRGRPKELAKAITIPLYGGRDLKERVLRVVQAYQEARQRKVIALQAKFAQFEQIKSTGLV